jgi:hypothetical protein
VHAPDWTWAVVCPSRTRIGDAHALQRNVRQITSGKVVPVFLFAVSGLLAQAPQPPKAYEPLTASERLKWFGSSSFGPTTMAFSLVTSGFSTWQNDPAEWGPGWEGFGRRYGSSLGRRVIANGVEASLGAVWAEDPRYHRIREGRVAGRVGNVLKMTVLAYNGQGNTMPAYSRYAGLAVSSYSAFWLPDRQRDAADFFSRIAVNLAGRLTGNATREFWPDLKRKIRRPKPSDELLQNKVK